MKRLARRRHKIRQKKSIFRKPAFWWLFLFSLLAATAIYFLVFFEKFQISKIIISGNEKIQTQEIERLVSEKVKQKLWFGVFSQSIFLATPGKIKESLLEQYPNIAFLIIKRKLPDALIVNIQERQPAAVFCNNDECFFIDEIGVIFEKISDDKARNSFLIVRSRLNVEDSRLQESEQFGEKEIILGEEIVKKEVIEFIVKVEKDLEEKFQIGVKEADILSEERLNIMTSEGWEIYLNLTADIDLQITKLNLLLEKEIPQESRAGLKYIDLRFERAYICNKNSACSK